MITPGEQIRDKLIEKGTDAVKEAAYVAGNSTDSLGQSRNFIIKTGSVLEASKATGNLAFKASRDYSRGDPLCTGLCTVCLVCEITAIACSTCKFIPNRQNIWLASKGISRVCVEFRNNCAGEGC